ncbi:MAG: hypothetical protein B6U87_02490 [Candidatus Aenigmarchaeota archaeon ex4484_52]|nr:MAG: hypothetical protein B6U87_02490 [Candidatus Aenigmarchaeota archaeon ex4484_52]
MFKFLRKKISPEEMEINLKITTAKLQKRENNLKAIINKNKDDAKQSLKTGDDRKFNRISQRYLLAQKQLKYIEGLTDTAMAMNDAIQMQKGMKELVNVTEEFAQIQTQLGIDPQRINKAVSHIQTASQKTEAMAENLALTMDAAMGSGMIEEKEEVENLKKELIGELSAETEAKEDLDQKIKKELAEE